MNVLILSTHFNSGGITSYLLTLIKGLCQDGHKVYAITSGGNMDKELKALGAEHIYFDIQTKSELSPKIYFALPELCRFIKEKNIDVIHTQTRITHVMGALLNRWTKKPHVTTCHGFYKKRLSRKLFPCWGSETIAISGAVRDYLINDVRLDTRRVHLIHNGLDFDAFLPVSEEAKAQRRKHYNLGREPLIGIIARLSDVKGHSFLIEAMSRVIKEVYNAHLLIVGQGRMESELKDLVAQTGLNECIHFYPVVNQTAELLSILDVFVLPTLEEGFGLSILEAQAMELPVIASRVGGVPDLIKDNETGILVAPKDVPGLARAIIELLQDKARAKQIGANARQYVQSEFSMKSVVDNTIHVYESASKGL